MQFVPAAIKSTTLAALLAVVGVPLGDPGGAGSTTVDLTMSNFRYCAATTCSPADQGYVRTSSGPVAGSDNPHAVIDVPQGSTVRWIYRDAGPGSCDFFAQCPGHNVRFEDGTSDGAKVGFAKARSGPTEITATITQPAGTLIRYFCTVNNHYETGMTGILRVVPPAGRAS